MGHPPVVVVESGGVPRTQVAEGGSAPAATVADVGRPITLTDNAPPIMLYDESGAPWSAYSDEAEALFARFTTPPTVARKLLIDNFIVSLKTAGVWSKLDALHVTAAADSQAARQNWVQDAYNLTAFSSPVFTVDRGFTPDGSASYLDSGFNPTTAVAPKFTLNDAHFGAWHLTDLANAGATSFDNGNATSRLANLATLQTQPRPNNAITAGITEDYAKHKGWTRSAAGVWEYYNSGVDAGGGTDASTALTSFAFGLGRTAGAAFGLNQCALQHWGGNLTAGEVLALYNAANTYMQAVGAAA